MKKIVQTNEHKKQVRMANLIADKIDFNQNKSKDKDKYNRLTSKENPQKIYCSSYHLCTKIFLNLCLII